MSGQLVRQADLPLDQTACNGDGYECSAAEIPTRIMCRKWLREPGFAHLLSVDSGWLNLFEFDNSWSIFGDSN